MTVDYERLWQTLSVTMWNLLPMASTLKGTRYFKNQDSSKEILIKRKENLKKIKRNER